MTTSSSIFRMDRGGGPGFFFRNRYGKVVHAQPGSGKGKADQPNPLAAGPAILGLAGPRKRTGIVRGVAEEAQSARGLGRLTLDTDEAGNLDPHLVEAYRRHLAATGHTLGEFKVNRMTRLATAAVTHPGMPAGGTGGGGTPAAKFPSKAFVKPVTPATGGDVQRYQFRANKEGGQSFGTQQEVRPLTAELYDRHVKGSVGGQSFADYQRQHPDVTHVSLTRQPGQDWRLSGVGKPGELGPSKVARENGWVKPVTSHDSAEAKAFGAVADSSLPGATAASARAYETREQRIARVKAEGDRAHALYRENLAKQTARPMGTTGGKGSESGGIFRKINGRNVFIPAHKVRGAKPPEVPLVEAAKAAKTERQAKLEKLADAAIAHVQAHPAADPSGVAAAVAAQAAARGEDVAHAGTPAAARPVAATAKAVGGKGEKGPTKTALEQTMVEAWRAQGGDNSVEDDKTLSAFHAPFTFHKNLPEEVKHFLQGNQHLGRLFTTTPDSQKAQGADVMGQLGTERYFALAERRGGAELTAALDHARNSPDPELRLTAHIYDTLPGDPAGAKSVATRAAKAADAAAHRAKVTQHPDDISEAKRAKANAENLKQRADEAASGGRGKVEHVQPESLKVDEAGTINKIPVHVTIDSDGNKILTDGGDLPDTPIDALTKPLPFDKGSRRQGAEPDLPPAKAAKPAAAAPEQPNWEFVDPHTGKLTAAGLQNRREHGDFLHNNPLPNLVPGTKLTEPEIRRQIAAHRSSKAASRARSHEVEAGAASVGRTVQQRQRRTAEILRTNPRLSYRQAWERSLTMSRGGQGYFFTNREGQRVYAAGQKQGGLFDPPAAAIPKEAVKPQGQSLEDFAAHVQKLGNEHPVGLGENKVYLSHIAAKSGMPPEAFKAKVKEAAHHGLLKVSRADMPLNPAEEARSEIDMGPGGTAHYLEVAPRARTQIANTMRPTVKAEAGTSDRAGRVRQGIAAPHEHTLAEYRERQAAPTGYAGAPASVKASIDAGHAKAVREARAGGETIHPDVSRDYPDKPKAAIDPQRAAMIDRRIAKQYDPTATPFIPFGEKPDASVQSDLDRIHRAAVERVKARRAKGTHMSRFARAPDGRLRFVAA